MYSSPQSITHATSMNPSLMRLTAIINTLISYTTANTVYCGNCLRAVFNVNTGEDPGVWKERKWFRDR